MELLAYPRGSVVSRKSKSLTFSVASSLVCTAALVVITRTVSSSAMFRSFLLSRCIEASESATNSLFFGFVDDSAGRHQASECEKNVALSVSLRLRTPLAISHASLRAHRSCFKVSSHENQCAESHLATRRSCVVVHPLRLAHCASVHELWDLPFNRTGFRRLNVLEYGTLLAWCSFHKICSQILSCNSDTRDNAKNDTRGSCSSH